LARIHVWNEIKIASQQDENGYEKPLARGQSEEKQNSQNNALKR